MSLLTLTAMDRARRLGLSLALVFRLALLFAISWVRGLTAPLFTVVGMAQQVFVMVIAMVAAVGVIELLRPRAAPEATPPLA